MRGQSPKMTRGQALQMTGWEARSHAVRAHSGRRPRTLRTPSEDTSHAVRAHSARRQRTLRTPSEAGSDGVIQGAGRRGDQWIQAPGLKLYTLTSPGLNHAGTVPEFSHSSQERRKIVLVRQLVRHSFSIGGSLGVGESSLCGIAICTTFYSFTLTVSQGSDPVEARNYTVLSPQIFTRLCQAKRRPGPVNFLSNLWYNICVDL